MCCAVTMMYDVLLVVASLLVHFASLSYTELSYPCSPFIKPQHYYYC